MPQRIISFDNRKRRVRAIAFDRPDDPYFLTHGDELELSDERIRAHYAEYEPLPRARDIKSDEYPHGSELFEDFLEWLEDEKGYDMLISAGETMQF